MQNVYDNKKFFEEYLKIRKKNINANDLIEIPLFKQLLPDFKNMRILELGCGYGELAKFLIDNGASEVVATDISKNMIDLAKQKNSSSKIKYLLLPMENLGELNEQFDLVVSSLAFHYVEDFNKLISDISKLLKTGGSLIFSQEHPVETAFKPPAKNKELSTKQIFDGKTYYLLSDYNLNGKRVVKWNIDGVIKYHRNMSSIINALAFNNFKIEQMIESYADEEVIKIEPKYKYQNDRPYFLLMCAKKI